MAYLFNAEISQTILDVGDTELTKKTVLVFMGLKKTEKKYIR